MTKKTPRTSWYALILLLLVYILNQWDRYSIVYLSGVAIPNCPNENSTDACFLDAKSEFALAAKSPLCSADKFKCPVGDTQCQRCQVCLDENNGEYLNLKYGTCISGTQYAILASYGFIFLFSVTGLVAGRVADHANRKWLLSTALCGWSFCMIGQGRSAGFIELLTSRIFLGVFEAFSAPASYSMISDLFPVSSRGTANGVFSFGVYVGGGLGSLSIILAGAIGWRGTSYLCGGLGIGLSILLAGTVREPARNRLENDSSDEQDRSRYGSTSGAEDDQIEQLPRSRDGSVLEDVLEGLLHDESSWAIDNTNSLEEPSLPETRPDDLDCSPVIPHTAPSESVWTTFRSIFSDRAIVLLYTAGALRFVGGMTIGTFLPEYFKRQYPTHNSEYSVLNAGVVSVGGALSSYMGGYYADRWSRHEPRARVWIPALGCVTGYIPFVVLLLANNFYISVGMLFLEYLFAECWFAGALSVIQNRVQSHRTATAIAAYLFSASMLGNLAPALIGVLDDGSTARSLRYILLTFVGISYGGAAILFMTCGQSLVRKPLSRRSTSVDSDVQQPLLSQEQ